MSREAESGEAANEPLPFVRSVFHPSDFSPESARAFAHALAIALLRRTDLTLLHVARDFHAEDEWRRFPAVRLTLERWGLLEPGSPRSAVFQKLGMGVQKVALERRRPVAAMLEFLDEHPTDLIVLSTGGHEGLPAWLRQSVAERLARRSQTMTLFVPAAVRGFVSLDDGSITLRRILVPVDHSPDPTPAVARAARSAVLAAGEPVEIHLLHVGEERDVPSLQLPDAPTCSFQRRTRPGNVVDGIEETARDIEADLIVLATRGHEGILDALRGSVTEQVVRRAPCPVLAVPAEE